MIALHGCSGMYSVLAEHRDDLSRHNAAWTVDLLGDGYAVLFPDSFNPRGQREVCTTRPELRTIFPRHRRLDALGALTWLAAQRGIDGPRGLGVRYVTNGLGGLGWGRATFVTYLTPGPDPRLSPDAGSAQ